MNNQEIFDLVCDKLAHQKAKSYIPESGCLYRAPNGLKCAAGHLIKDEHYTPSLEFRLANEEPVKEALISSGVDESQIHLVRSLQLAHDESYDLNTIQRGLERVAIEFGLSRVAVEKFTYWNSGRRSDE